MKNGVRGIDAECDGACACATCTVFVDQAGRDQLPAPDDIGRGHVGFAERDQPDARLSCRITVGEARDGLAVRISENQR